MFVMFRAYLSQVWMNLFGVMDNIFVTYMNEFRLNFHVQLNQLWSYV